MSLSNPTQSTPAQRFFKWAGGDGNVVWWDKDAEKQLAVPLPFRFIVLDELSTLAGYSEKDQSGIWANEVRNIKGDVLVARTRAGVIGEGTYENLFEAKARGAKYARSIYIAYQDATDPTTWVIGNLKVAGAAVGAWFDFRRKINVEEFGVILSGSTVEKKGATTFHVPDFGSFEIEATDMEVAVELDRQLQDYLAKSLTSRPGGTTEEQRLVEGAQALREELTADGEELDLSQIPF